jgi:hypothetical protein
MSHSQAVSEMLNNQNFMLHYDHIYFFIHILSKYVGDTVFQTLYVIEEKCYF